MNIKEKDMKKIFCALIIGLISVSVYGQYANTMYFMDRTPQVAYSNPAMAPHCKWWLGGSLVPLAGQVPPTFSVQVTMPISYSDVLYYGEADSLLTPWFPSQDVNDFIEKLRRNNIITEDIQISLLHGGFKVGKNVFSIDLSERQDFSFAFPKKCLDMLSNGINLGEDIDFSGFQLSTSAYHQLALGYSREVNDKLTLGMRAKFLVGLLNVSTDRSELRLIYDDDLYNSQLNIDYSLNTNVPLDSITYDEKHHIEAIDFLDVVEDDFKFPNNYGFGFDFGMNYKLSDRLTLSASVLDLGRITWSNHVHNLMVVGQSDFNALRIEPIDGEDATNWDYIANRIADAADDISGEYAFSDTQKSYNTLLNTQIYVGGTYQLSKRWQAGGLAHLTHLYDIFKQTYTLSASYAMSSATQFVLSTSYIDKSFANIGFACTFHIMVWQMFFATDNVLAAYMPKETHSIDIRMGANLLFGREDARHREKKEKMTRLWTGYSFFN